VEALGAAFAAMWEVLAGVVSFVGELMAPVLAELGVAFSDLWTAIQPVVLVLGGILVAAIGIVVGVLAGLIAGIAGLALGFAKILVGVVQMATGIIDIVVGLVEVIIGLIRGNNEQVAEAWEKMKSGAINILTGLWNVVVGIFAGLFLAVVLAIGTFIETVIQFFTTLYEKLVGGSIIPDMVKAIVEWFTTLASDAIALVSDLVAKVVEWFTTLVADAVALATEFVTGIIDQIKELPVKVKTWMMKTLDNVKMLTSKFKEVGGNLIKGLAQGIKDAAGKVIDAAKAVVTSAINAAKNLLREGSPSKVFMEIGEDVSLGMGVGIEKGARYPIGAIGGLVSGMTRAAGQSVTNQTTNYYSTNVEVNPTYRNYESEAGIYYDVSAALSGVRQ